MTTPNRLGDHVDVQVRGNPLSTKATRALAQRRGYERWNQEMARRHRRELDEPTEAPDGSQDLTNLEHLATADDLVRLNEILREEYARVGQTSRP